MPATRTDRARVLLRTAAPWRRILAERTVRRTVQGVTLFLPWSHRLPDYAWARPTYGQNLVELAAALAAQTGGDAGFRLLDIGANIGDSAVQILHRVEGRALCVEADPYWLDYLHRNVDGDARIEVEPVLLTAEADEQHEVSAVRRGGTTKFLADDKPDPRVQSMSVTALRRAHPDFDRVRLVKSDTDGFDTSLVIAAARAWSDCRPVLFFEFDPALTRQVTGTDANDVWAALDGLGYRHLLVWDNTGDPLGRLETGAAAAAATSSLGTGRSHELGYQFWDVAACHIDDAAALAALDSLVTAPFDERGVGARSRR